MAAVSADLEEKTRLRQELIRKPASCKRKRKRWRRPVGRCWKRQARIGKAVNGLTEEISAQTAAANEKEIILKQMEERNCQGKTGN